MQNFIKLFLIFMISTLYGCNIIRSSTHFTKGTRCLEEGDLQGARFHLEKACEIEPRISLYHNNLTCTYTQLGEMEKAWYHARQAVYLNPRNQEAVTNFNNFMHELESFHNIGKGSSKEEVITALGIPDDAEYVDSEYNNGGFRYGLSILIFEDGKLTYRSAISILNGKYTISPPTPI